MLYMLGDQSTQMLFVDSQRVHAQDFDQFRIHAFAEFAVFVQHVGEPARHACAEVDARFTENTDDAAGHVFTAVVTDAFDHGDGT
ncbi:hypothetical protein D3C73_1363960 [compost metagenome]